MDTTDYLLVACAVGYFFNFIILYTRYQRRIDQLVSLNLLYQDVIAQNDPSLMRQIEARVKGELSA